MVSLASLSMRRCSSRWLAPIALGAVGLIAYSPAVADTKAGVDAWESGQFDRAVAEWRTAAATGDADAAFNLGQAYKVGRGVPQDLEQALTWYRQAMNAGHVRASDYYGLLLYQMGRRAQAMDLIRQSAARGEPRAQYVLGAELFNGTLVEKDWVRAYAMMTRASAQGLEPANRVLAEMDEHIPLAERQQGILLANQIEQSEASNRVVQMGSWDLRPIDQASAPAAPIASATSPVAQNSAAIEQVDLPPSRATLASSATIAEQTSPAMPVKTAELDGTASSPAQKSPAATTPKPRADGLPAGYVPSVGPIASTAPSKAAPAAKVKVTPPAAAKAAPKSANGGGWRVQMGAYSAMESAERVWKQYQGKVSGLSAYQPYLVKAGGLVKLQYGPFASKAEADKSCRAVETAGGACFTLKKD